MLAIALSVLGMNKEPVFREWAVGDGTFYFAAPRDATAADAGTGGVCGGEKECVGSQVSCWNRNRATLLPLLTVPARRSEGGDAAAAALGG